VFDHVTIRVSDRHAAQRFYTAVLDVLGVPIGDGADDLPEWEVFSLLEAGAPHRVTQGVHIGFAAHSRQEVDAFWREGIAAGALDDGAPGPRPQYRVAGHQVVEVSPGHVEVKGASGSFALLSGTPSRGVHMAFPADDDATVDAFHGVATAAGHPSNGEPGERPEYHAGYYGAFVLDPDGNNIELVNHNR
jgi:catechol 2,3-dioxygenase-like lactoylglutathione lyase family enzyme